MITLRKQGGLAAAGALFHREYAEVRALDGISFTVGKGEMVGVIGPNGAGKSTVIKIMSGILVPDSGECTILDMIPWKSRRKYVGHIGVVFGQRTQLWWDVPVRDSFDLLGDIYTIPPDIGLDAVSKLATRRFIAHLNKESPPQSGGVLNPHGEGAESRSMRACGLKQ
ncbi:MAG: ATP-binding cassette domain-containing protein [Treponema sp.]|jgi:ABC-2 type transport system ATP-binding protein|nr:ATP-binding cassette domain-containing protein [Treponema sp.]